MRRIKHIVSLLLAAVLCLSLLPVIGAGAEETMEERQQAIVATAFAFYDKGQPVQYDGNAVNNVRRTLGGHTRSTFERGPEFATPKETVYSVCSDFCYQTYFSAIGYRLCGNQGSCWTAALADASHISSSAKSLVYRYSFTSHQLESMPADKVEEYGQPAGETDDEKNTAAITKLLDLAQPGDLITTLSGSGGHSTVYVGEVKGDGVKYLMHCYGVGIGESTGIDTIEVPAPKPTDLADEKYKTYSDANGGSIRLTAAFNFLNGSAHGGTGSSNDNRTLITLLRPLNNINQTKYPISAAARTRMTYPRLSIDRTTDKSRFNATRTGDTLNLYIKLKNSSDAAYTLPVTEKIPAGATLLSASDDAAVSGDTITWSGVTLDAGEEKTLTVAYRISAIRGQYVTFEDGAVGGIPSNSIAVPVGGAGLRSADVTKLADIANGTYDAVLSTATDATLGQVVYENILGITGVEFPAIDEVSTKLMTVVNKTAHSGGGTVDVLTFKDEIDPADAFLERITVPHFFGGKDFWVIDSGRRVLDTKAMYMEPGDVIVRLDSGLAPTSCRTLVCIGDDQFLQLNETTGAPEIMDHRELVRSHQAGLFYALRPTLAYADLYPAPAMEQYMSLNLNDVVVINYYLADAGSTFTSNSYVLVDGERTSLVREGTNWYLPVRESTAKEMTRQSTVQLVTEDGEGVNHYGNSYEISIRGYAETMLGLTDWDAERDAKLGRTMIGMLEYGAEAQKYFDYQTDDLANKNLTETDRARMTVYTPATLGEYRVNGRETSDPEGLYYASSCVLGSSQALRFYLDLPESREDRSELTFRVKYRNYNGENRTATKTFAELTASNASGIYYFEVSGMAAADVKTEVTLTVEKAGSTVATIKDSIASYCARVYDSHEEVRDLADAVLVYGLSARDYFYKPVPDYGDNEMPLF